MSELSDLAVQATEAVPPRVAKVLDLAAGHGWEVNPRTPGATLVIRLDRPCDRREHESLKDWQARGAALPFYVRWDMVTDKTSGRRSWRFQGARAANGQALAWGDIATYLASPEVIHPEEPPEVHA